MVKGTKISWEVYNWEELSVCVLGFLGTPLRCLASSIVPATLGFLRGTSPARCPLPLCPEGTDLPRESAAPPRLAGPTPTSSEPAHHWLLPPRLWAGDPTSLATLPLGGDPAAASAAFLCEKVSPFPPTFSFSHTFYFIV